MVQYYPNEKFKEIDVEEGLTRRYAISNLGRFLSFVDEFEEGRILKCSKTDGYRVWHYSIRNPETGKVKNYHRFLYHIVAEYHFVKGFNFERQSIIHLDRNRENDAVENLKYVTKEQWWEHWKASPYTNDMMKKNLSLCVGLKPSRKLEDFQVDSLKAMLKSKKYTQKYLAGVFGISEMQVSRIKRGENWKDE